MGMLASKQLLARLSTSHSRELFSDNEQFWFRPESIQDIVVPLELSKSVRGDNIFLFDSGSDDKNQV